MAHVQQVQTGFRVETHVQGRVYRQQPGRQREHSTAARVQKRAIQRRRICLLSSRDARWLEEYAVNQPCFGPGCTHAHHTRKQIEQMVASGQLRWIGESRNVAAWTDPREWRGVRGSMQLVPLGSGMSRLQQRGIDSARVEMVPADGPMQDDL